MSNILLVEPNYRSKFPPLGLMRLATYHKELGDSVTFVRGMNPELKSVIWHRIYIASLFTWELPRTLKTIKFYTPAVATPKNIYVGGIGVTLMPEYIRSQVECTIIEGQIDSPNRLGKGSPVIAKLPPDYSILNFVNYNYFPKDAYFVRITKGCPRSCEFCAVPLLEKDFGYLNNVSFQVKEIEKRHGEKRHLVILDNNILAIDCFDKIVDKIVKLGFQSGATKKGEKRTVDFNQGIDARIIAQNPYIANTLSSICMEPVRLAFDHIGMKKVYLKTIHLLREQGFKKFTNYILFNFKDTPLDLYERFQINVSLNEKYGIRITGFPMRFIPMNSVSRHYVSNGWKWRYLRGIQCVLLATRGLVSPNPEFVRTAFGENFEEFLEILSMPDRYIIHRFKYKNNEASDWRKKFRKLSKSDLDEFLDILYSINRSRNKKQCIEQQPRKYWKLIDHYYPNGNVYKDK